MAASQCALLDVHTTSPPLLASQLCRRSAQAGFPRASLPRQRYKSKGDEDENKPPPLEKLSLLGSVGADTIARATTLAAGVLLTRGLVASP